VNTQYRNVTWEVIKEPTIHKSNTWLWRASVLQQLLPLMSIVFDEGMVQIQILLNLNLYQWDFYGPPRSPHFQTKVLIGRSPLVSSKRNWMALFPMSSITLGSAPCLRMVQVGTGWFWRSSHSWVIIWWELSLRFLWLSGQSIFQ
jgi:hypothetical protein